MMASLLTRFQNKRRDDVERILVTGAAGQIGGDLVAALCEQYGMDRIIASDIGERPKESLACTYYQESMMDKNALHAMCIAENIKVIYHLSAVLFWAGEQLPLRTWEVNIHGLLNVLEIAKLNGIRVFWPGSVAVLSSGNQGSHGQQISDSAYGITKITAELWCRYYHSRYGVDVRSLRFPGIVGHKAMPDDGATDYTSRMFHEAVWQGAHTCRLPPDRALPMVYMPDAIKAMLQLMAAPAEKIAGGEAYTIAAMSFTPAQLAAELTRRLGAFNVRYSSDDKVRVIDHWPETVDDRQARHDWGWQPDYDLEKMTADMLQKLKKK